jgi:hypothetical protein
LIPEELPAGVHDLEKPQRFGPVLGMDHLRPFLDTAHLLPLVSQDPFQAAAPDDIAMVMS